MIRRVLKVECVVDDLVARHDACGDLDKIAGDGIACFHEHAPEGSVASWLEDVGAVVELEDRGGGNDGMQFGMRTFKNGGGEHAEAEQVLRIVHLNANLGGAQGGVELCADVADGSGEGFTGEGVEGDVSVLAEMDVGEVILVDVADDPDVGQVGDSKGASGACVGDTGSAGSRDVLGEDDAGGGCVDMHVVAGVIFIDAEDFELLFRREEISLGIVFAVLSGVLLGLGNGAFGEEKVVAVEGDGGKMLVVDGLEIAIEGGGDVGALNIHDELALMDVIAELDMEGDDATVGEREDREFAGDIGVDRAGDLECAANGLRRCLDEGEAAGTVDVNDVRASDFFYLGGGRSRCGRRRGILLATREAECEEKNWRGDEISCGGTLLWRAGMLLDFQRYIHRFRGLMHASIGQESITLRVNHLECGTTVQLCIL